MLANNYARLFLFGFAILFLITSCGVFKGDPILPQEIVDAIAQESVKYFSNEAPEGALLVETAKLETFWGIVLSDEKDRYSDVICFKAEIQYVYQGLNQVAYYQGIVKKPKTSGNPWQVDAVSVDTWIDHNCSGDYMLRVTPTSTE